MIESPLLQEIIAEAKAEAKHESILRVLQARLGPVPADVTAAVRTVHDEQKLNDLLVYSALGPDLEAFRVRVQA